MAQIVTAEIQAYDIAGGVTRTLYYATQGYVTSERNLLRYSEQLDNAVWSVTNGISVTPNAAVAPNGTTSADRVAITNVTDPFIGQFVDFGQPIAGKTFTISAWLWVDAGQPTSANFYIYDLAASDIGFNTITLTTTPTRFSFTKTFAAGTAGNGVYARIDLQQGAASIGNYLYAWGVALTPSSIVEPYVRTTDSAVPNFIYYEGRIQQPANVARTLFSDRATFGASTIGFGNMVLVNNDGGLDGLIDLAWAGRPITIKLGEVFPRDNGVPTWTTVIRGVVEQAEFSWQAVTIRVRDRLFDLAQPLQQVRYAGTNTGSPQSGLEGVATDIANKPKPIVYGQVFNVPLTLVNADRNIYQAHEAALQSVDAVYNRGKTLTAGAAYPDQATLESTAPAGGTYRVWNTSAGCYIRLADSAANGAITADLTEGATAADRTVAQVLKRIMLKAGISSGDINASDVTALDAACSYPVGMFCATAVDVSALEALDTVAVSIGAWFAAIGDGTFRLGQLVLPSSGTSVGTINGTDIIAIDRVASRDPGAGLPAYKIKLGYQRMWVKQDDLASDVPQSHKNKVGQRHRRREKKNNTVKTYYPISPELQFLTTLVSQTDAENEAQRRLDIYSSRRDMLQVKVRISDSSLASVLELGKIVTLQIGRYGLSAGKKFLVIGIRTDMRGRLFDLTLWG